MSRIEKSNQTEHLCSILVAFLSMGRRPQRDMAKRYRAGLISKAV